MKNLIDLRSVYKIYNEGLENEVRALNGISLRIDSGEFVSIIGASGSGKTTLMNILGCLDVPTYGEYFLNGEYVSAFTGKELAHVRNRQIGFVFQGFNLISNLNALENVELPLVYQGVRGEMRVEMAADALFRVGLSERLFHRPFEMSGGQQQRIAIARAIAAKPPIIMADEPTGNLDSRTGAHVVSILHDLHSEGATIILITHDSELSKIAPRSIRISDGIIVSDRSNVAMNGGAS